MMSRKASQIPFIPENAPFTPEQRLWLNGYFAGLFSDAAADARLTTTIIRPTAPPLPLVILYGSQTGTAEGLAKKTAREAENRGFAPTVVCMENYDPLQLARTKHLLVVTSTYGDGDPPDNAQAFWNWLRSDTAPRMEQLLYAVLALGDTNYPAFCAFGRACDARLAALGAQRIHPRVDCDLEYELPAKAWSKAVLDALATDDGAAAPPAQNGTTAMSHLADERRHATSAEGMTPDLPATLAPAAKTSAG